MPDGFGGVFEGGVGSIDDNLGDNGDDFFAFAKFDKSIIDSLSEPIANLTLTHGDCGFEGHGGSLLGGGLLFMNQNIADLRTVAVGDDDFVFVG